MLYTGGTTGMPKGVMWRQDDLFARLIDGGVRHYPVDGGLDGGAGRARSQPRRRDPHAGLPAHARHRRLHRQHLLAEGGRVCLLESRKYDPVELLDTIEREKVNGLVIVGDPFSAPLLAALDAHPGHWDLSSLVHDDLLGRHVERAGQAGAARATTPA